MHSASLGTPLSPARKRPVHRSRPLLPPLSVLIATGMCSLVVLCLAAASDALQHWFVIPVLLCGILVGIDAIDWMRGRLRPLDPVGIIGLIGLHFFFAAPLLHVYWDVWMRYVSAPADWRSWLGGMAILNCLGLCAYRLVVHFPRGAARQPRRVRWNLRQSVFPWLLAFGLLTTALLQAWVYYRLGGISGYVRAFVDLTGAFAGMGWIFTMSESFPILACMGYAVVAERRAWSRSWLVLASVLLLFFVLKLGFGGLRGSRANTLWGLFWAVGILHLWVRRITRKMVLAGIVFAVVFSYVYGFYKGAGVDALELFEGSASRVELEQRTGRTMAVGLLGDFGRSDVQAFLLFRLMEDGRPYDYRLGETYIAAFALLIPRRVWPDRPMGKVEAGTEIQYGPGARAPSMTGYSTRQYGLAGEAMLNFGILGVPLAFVVFGLIVRWVRRVSFSWEGGDSRLLILPFLINLTFLLLVADFDNVLFSFVKNGAVPLVLILLASSRLREPAAPARRYATVPLTS